MTPCTHIKRLLFGCLVAVGSIFPLPAKADWSPALNANFRCHSFGYHEGFGRTPEEACRRAVAYWDNLYCSYQNDQGVYLTAPRRAIWGGADPVAGTFTLTVTYEDPSPDPAKFRSCGDPASIGPAVYGTVRRVSIAEPACPPASPPFTYDAARGLCTRVVDPAASPAALDLAKANGAEFCPLGSNPINPATGNKFQRELDYVGPGDFPLAMVRAYNSAAIVSSPFGEGWTSNYHRRVLVGDVTQSVVKVVRSDGRVVSFRRELNTFVAPIDSNDRLEQLVLGNVLSGWRYVSASRDEVEMYDGLGRLVSVTNRAGLRQTLSYETAGVAAGLLARVADAFGRELTFQYDAQGGLAKIILPGGSEIAYARDANRNLASVIQPGSNARLYHYEDGVHVHALTGISSESGARYATFEYDHQGRAILSEHAGGAGRVSVSYSAPLVYESTAQVTVTDALETARSVSFEVLHGLPRQKALTGPECSTCQSPQFAYDARGHVSESRDWNGIATSYQRGDPSRPDLETSRTEAVGTSVARTIATDWHPDFRLPVRTTEPGRVIETAYDSRGNVVSRTARDTASGRTRTWTWTRTYSAAVPGAIESVVVDGPRSDVADVTTMEYWPATAACPGADAAGCRGQLRRVTNALGHVTEIAEYNAHGQPTNIVDPNGLVTVLAYDARRRLVTRTAGTETTSYAYTAAGELSRVTQPDASYLEFEYDDARRLRGIRDASGNRKAFVLDDMGNRLREESYDAGGALRSRLTREYNAANRLARQIGGSDPAAQVTTFGYDAAGNLTSVDGPLVGFPNDVWRFEYDPLNRVRNSIDPYGGTTRYAYDLLDRVLSVSDPRNVVTTFVVNGLGEETEEVSADRGTILRTFNAAGDVMTERDGRGFTRQYAYDALGRLTSQGLGTRLEYDGGGTGQAGVRGRLTHTTRGGPLTLRYDIHGRVIERRQTAGSTTLVVSYAYDAAGRLSSMTYPSGKTVSFHYDGQGRVSAIVVDGTPLVTDVRYFPFGGVESFVWGNGTSYLRTFDLDGRVVSFPAGTSRRTVAYDAAGRITGISDRDIPAAGFAATYDSAGRLKSYAGFPASQTFTYDANGNRTVLEVGGSAFPYTIQAGSNRLLASAGPGPSRTYAYDGMGNTLSDGVRTFSYDAFGRMNGGRIGTSTGMSANHNAFGERTRKGPGGMWNFAYDEGGRLVGEYRDRTLLIPQEYVYLGDLPVAVLQGPRNAPEVYYVHADHLTTPRVVVDAQNRVRWRWDGGPFGDNPPDQDPMGLGPFVLNLRFPGQYFDSETGLHYNYFRDYDPQTGRYVQSDPIGLAGGINPYLYVRASPLSRRDLFGLFDGLEDQFLPGTDFFPSANPGDPPIPPSIGAPRELELGFSVGVDLLRQSQVAASYALAMGVGPRAAIGVCRAAVSVKDPCKNPIIVAALGTSFCSGSLPDEFLSDLQRKREISRGTDLAGQRKIGVQGQRP